MVRATVGEVFSLTLATAPQATGEVVRLTALFSTDGEDVGVDADGEALVLPLVMDEGADGVYSADVIIEEVGPYWARIDLDGDEYTVLLIRVQPAGYPAAEATTDTPFTVFTFDGTAPAAVTLTLKYPDGTSAGADDNGDDLIWPSAMEEVAGEAGCFFFEDITVSQGGTLQTVFVADGTVMTTGTVEVFQEPQSGAYAHFDGFQPDAAFDPADWISLSYIRKWTGWSSDVVENSKVRELRDLAIETFIHETNLFASGWNGTWNGLRSQGRRLYLPMPVLLPSQGGSTPTLTYTYPYGDKETVTELSLDDIVWSVGGSNAKQPYIELSNGNWDGALHLKLSGTWGSWAPGSVPLRVKQALVGLIRWHSLSYGTDPEDARDQATVNRITSQSNRDMTESYHETAIGRGITGDRTTDRLLAELRVNEGPWVRRSGCDPDPIDVTGGGNGGLGDLG